MFQQQKDGDEKKIKIYKQGEAQYKFLSKMSRFLALNSVWANGGKNALKNLCFWMDT